MLELVVVSSAANDNLGVPFSGIISSSLAMHHFRVANGP